MSAEPTVPPTRPRVNSTRKQSSAAGAWRQAELERIWFARVESGIKMLCDQPQKDWNDVADHFRCGASTLRLWRRRYGEAQQRAS